MTSHRFFPKIAELTELDQFILFVDKQLVVRDSRFIWRLPDLKPMLQADTDIVLVEEQAGTRLIAINFKQDASKLIGAELQSLRSVLLTHDENMLGTAGRANQVVTWYVSHRFCGSCGSATLPHESQRVLVCAQCASQFFPRINPCAIMLVVRGDEMLLARSSRFKSGFFSTLAGFIEIGETPEETVVREVREEVGLQVNNVRYASSQSWPFPSQLMLGFYADYESGELVLEEDEIAEAGWFGVDQLPPVPSAHITIAGQLIEGFIRQVRCRN